MREEIQKRVEEHSEELRSLGYTEFVTVLQGSQNYGLDIQNEDYSSDVDTKALILPSFDSFVAGSAPISHTHVRENNEHIDIKDIRNYFEQFKKQNLNFMEILYSDYYSVNPEWEEEWKELRSYADDLTTCHPALAVKSMFGIAMQKYEALEHRYPSIAWKIDKWGYDGKQLHHIIRIYDFIYRYIEGESYKRCLIPSPRLTPRLIEAKLNKYSLQEAEVLADTYIASILKMKNEYIEKYGEGILTTEPYKKLDELKIKILKKHFKKLLENM